MILYHLTCICEVCPICIFLFLILSIKALDVYMYWVYSFYKFFLTDAFLLILDSPVSEIHFRFDVMSL